MVFEGATITLKKMNGSLDHNVESKRSLLQKIKITYYMIPFKLSHVVIYVWEIKV